MARIKIGNIKGPAGPKGATGSQGPIGPVGPQGPLPPLTNNFLATVAGKSALDAVAGKTLKDLLDQQNSDKASKTDLAALSAANTVLGSLKYLPVTNIDNPNAFLRLTGWENSAYMSYVSLPALSGFTLVLGIYDHNNGVPKGRQFAITPGKLASRGYSAGVWTAWVDK